MASVRNCHLPDALYYHVEANVWARREPDGTVTVGMTAYACALSGEIVACVPRKIGRMVEAGKSAATVESGKWVGPVKSPVSGEVIEINDAVLAHPASINADPYGKGWLVKIRPVDWERDARALVTGAAAVAAFEQRMAADGFPGC